VITGLTFHFQQSKGPVIGKKKSRRSTGHAAADDKVVESLHYAVLFLAPSSRPVAACREPVVLAPGSFDHFCNSRYKRH
jgi:hypothetical protein